MEIYLFIMDIIGTVAFAVSGALVGIRKEMDIFGVNILAIVTAVGGGMIRDILIGSLPPRMFTDPVYVIIAAAAANIIFLVFFFHKNMEITESRYHWLYEKIFLICDTLGLASFTVNGVIAGINLPMSDSAFLDVFLGVTTGVGGGILRDVLSKEMPVIFVRRIYAMAALAGAIAVRILWSFISQRQAVLIGISVIVAVRICAAVFRWNLPRVVHE